MTPRERERAAKHQLRHVLSAAASHNPPRRRQLARMIDQALPDASDHIKDDAFAAAVKLATAVAEGTVNPIEARGLTIQHAAAILKDYDDDDMLIPRSDPGSLSDEAIADIVRDIEHDAAEGIIRGVKVRGL